MEKLVLKMKEYLDSKYWCGEDFRRFIEGKINLYFQQYNVPNKIDSQPGKKVDFNEFLSYDEVSSQEINEVFLMILLQAPVAEITELPLEILSPIFLNAEFMSCLLKKVTKDQISFQDMNDYISLLLKTWNICNSDLKKLVIFKDLHQEFIRSIDKKTLSIINLIDLTSNFFDFMVHLPNSEEYLDLKVILSEDSNVKNRCFNNKEISQIEQAYFDYLTLSLNIEEAEQFLKTNYDGNISKVLFGYEKKKSKKDSSIEERKNALPNNTMNEKLNVQSPFCFQTWQELELIIIKGAIDSLFPNSFDENGNIIENVFVSSEKFLQYQSLFIKLYGAETFKTLKKQNQMHFLTGITNYFLQYYSDYLAVYQDAKNLQIKENDCLLMKIGQCLKQIEEEAYLLMKLEIKENDIKTYEELLVEDLKELQENMSYLGFVYPEKKIRSLEK